MPIHQTICPLKSINWCQNQDKVRKTKCNMHKSFGLILMRRLGRPPYQYSVPEEMIYRNTCGYLFVTFCAYAFWFTFIYAFVFQFQIRELIGIITCNYRLVDINFISPVISSRSPVFHDTFQTDKVDLSSTNQVTFCIVQLSPFYFILKTF